MGYCQKISQNTKTKRFDSIMATKKKQTKRNKTNTKKKKVGRAGAKKYKINPEVVKAIKKRKQKKK